MTVHSKAETERKMLTRPDEAVNAHQNKDP